MVECASLVVTPTHRVFMIGGRVQSEAGDEESKNNNAIARQDCLEVVNIRLGKNAPVIPGKKDDDSEQISTVKSKMPMRVIEKNPMINPRYAFGYATVEQGRFIVVAGGTLKRFSHTDQTEFYDTKKDKWFLLPKLNEVKCLSSVVNVDDQWVYAIGGVEHSDQVNKPVATVERIKFAEYVL